MRWMAIGGGLGCAAFVGLCLLAAFAGFFAQRPLTLLIPSSTPAAPAQSHTLAPAATPPSERPSDPTGSHSPSAARTPASLIAAPPATAAPTAAADRRPGQIDRIMAASIRADTPGAAVLVGQDGKVVHSAGYGLAEVPGRKPVTPSTAFNIASLSKPTTALAILMLSEKGALHLEDPLTRFFPDFPAYADKITVRHLLQHTSGLRDYESLYEDGALTGEPSSRDVLRLLAGQRSPKFAPGNRYDYSNSGYVVLAQIAEKVSGTPFPRLVRESIFVPAGMDQSLVLDETRPSTPSLAFSYSGSGRFERIDDDPLNLVYGDGGMVTTVGDLFKLDQALYSDRLIKAATLQAAFTPGTLNDGRKIEYGHGWEIGTQRGEGWVGHSGSWLGFRTVMMRFPRQRLVVIVLSNWAELDPSAVAEEIADLYLVEL